MTWDPNPHPTDPFPTGRPPPNARRGGMPAWAWVLLGGGGLMLLLCLGGTAVIGLMGIGAKVMEVEVRDQLRDNPKLREHIGEIRSFEVDSAGSFAESDSNTFRYKVEGTTGSGEMTVRHITSEDDKEVVEEAHLRLSDGTQVQIVP
jgi:hypothetical protein